SCLTLSLQLQGFAFGGNLDRVARLEFPLEQSEGQRIEESFLNGSLQRPRAELRVIAVARQELFGGLVQVEGQLLLRQALLQAFELNLHDLRELFLVEAVEDDDVV